MKHINLTLAACLCSMIGFSQNVPIDFETGGNGASWTWTVFENATNPALQVVANPAAGGINPSSTVAEFTALQAGNPWAGCESLHGADIGTFSLDPTTSEIRIMVYKPVASDVGIKLVDAGNASLGEIKVANTLINQWEELVFDFSSMEGITYDQIVIFPDFDLGGRTSDNVCYFDNVSFNPHTPTPMPLTPAPDPTEAANLVLSMFSDTYTDVTVDTWQTVWSDGILSDIMISGNATKQYSNLNFVGVETVGPNLINADSMEYFHVDFWSADATEFRIKWVDFGADQAFGGGDDTEHELTYANPTQQSWVSYAIPMTDFVNLTNRDNLAQLIFSAVPVGNSTIYIDNVYFSKDAPVNTGIEDLSLGNIKAYPNPGQGEYTFQFDAAVSEDLTYQVLSLTGQAMGGRQAVLSQNVTVDLTDLSNGVYFVKFESPRGASVVKLIKQ